VSHRDAEAQPLAGPQPEEKKYSKFAEVFAAEYDDLHERCPAIRAKNLGREQPSVANGLVGVALSGGGIRSATFCLGALQAMNAGNILRNVNYLSTVSGGGYIGTATTIAMSTSPYEFPFSKTSEDVGETPETRHLRDNSRYLVQNGLSSVLSAAVIYLRGITMNIIVVMPLVLIAAAVLVFLKPDTTDLNTPWSIITGLPAAIAKSPMPLSVLGLMIVAGLQVVYAIGVSIFPIISLPGRRRLAYVATVIMVIFALVVLLELHFVLLRAVFAAHGALEKPPAGAPVSLQINETIIDQASRFVRWITPLFVAVLPFLKSIGEKATSEAVGGFSDQLKKWASRILLIVSAAIIPLLLWLTTLQLAYWGVGVCASASGHCSAGWQHAPGLLQGLFAWVAGGWLPFGSPAGWAYVALAVLFLFVWPLLNVNANSLHQLYRDRLGSAFLVQRVDGKLEPADTFSLQQICRKHAPYHLLNAALNVPGSAYANRRGRNADFFIFSRNFIGSEATGYTETKLAEKVNDGLNIGTAMAISGAAAAPNMGMASLRPLSATIAMMNIRLGRWLRHPLSTPGDARRSKWAIRWRGKPGPLYLLREAFFKSGTHVVDPDTEEPISSGFVFLTDGGHIENLGIYELLKRRCALIIAIDGEADPEMTSGSLVQLERFARIDLGTRIVLDWEPIGARTREVSEEVAKRKVDRKHGPHVAVGLIDYPGISDGPREKGVLVYIKSSLSGDENDYVMTYKAAHPSFPHETTMDQLFSEEQLEAYRALGEHIASRFLAGQDHLDLPDELDRRTAIDRIGLAFRPEAEGKSGADGKSDAEGKLGAAEPDHGNSEPEAAPIDVLKPA